MLFFFYPSLSTRNATSAVSFAILFLRLACYAWQPIRMHVSLMPQCWAQPHTQHMEDWGSNSRATNEDLIDTAWVLRKWSTGTDSISLARPRRGLPCFVAVLLFLLLLLVCFFYRVTSVAVLIMLYCRPISASSSIMLHLLCQLWYVLVPICSATSYIMLHTLWCYLCYVLFATSSNTLHMLLC